MFYFRAQSCSFAPLQCVFVIFLTVTTHTDNLYLDAIWFMPIMGGLCRVSIYSKYKIYSMYCILMYLRQRDLS